MADAAKKKKKMNALQKILMRMTGDSVTLDKAENITASELGTKVDRQGNIIKKGGK